MTSARNAAIRPSPMATQFDSTPMNSQIEDAFALYGKWLGVAITDCEAWSTANPAFQQNDCAAHDGRTADQHHAHIAAMFAGFFEAALDASAAPAPSAAPATSAAPAATASAAISQGISPTTITAIAAVPSAASGGAVATVSSTQEQIGASHSASSSAALRTGLSAARCGGEPISPSTTTAIAAVPSAASDGMVMAASMTQQQIGASHSASSSAALRTGLSAARCGSEPLTITFRRPWPWLTVQLPFGGKVNRTIDATRTNAIVICLNQFYLEPKFSRQLVSNSAKSSFTTLMLSLCQALHIIPHQLLKRVRSS